MNYWLFKSEPDAWSWDQQKKEGGKGGEWDGVRNDQARNVMRSMKKGDLAFFYHSGEEKRVVGVVKVVAEAHPDSTDGTGVWECVDVAAVSDVPKPVTLAEIKATKALKNMVLATNSRLSVQPVSAEEWSIIGRLAGLKDNLTSGETK
jgi:predicted RNA-binding protein with PUA-like domain